MNLKYYLRGLGIGIVITALIMGITSGSRKETLSNEEIKERARALGMVEESTVLADILEPSPDTQKESKPTQTPAATQEPQSTITPTPEPIPTVTPEPTPTVAPTPEPTPTAEATAEPVPTATPAPVQTPETSPENGEASTVTIQINKGDGSLTVSRKLEEAGLVASAAEFDSYLCQNGYDKRLNVGTFEIPAGADAEQIAKILARQQ